MTRAVEMPEDFKRYAEDPRRDLADDHIPWNVLLCFCYDVCKEFKGTAWAVLYAARKRGARLTEDPGGNWVIGPTIGPRAHWRTREDWEHTRDEHLKPHIQIITTLLDRLATHNMGKNWRKP